MPSRHPRRSGDSSASVQQQLPFTGEAVDDADLTGDRPALGEATSSFAPSSASTSVLSTSYTQRTPARSFFHHASHSSADAPQYSSYGVRERTQALAAYALESEVPSPQHRPRSYTDSSTNSGRRSVYHRDTDQTGEGNSLDTTISNMIEEQPEPESPETVVHTGSDHSPFVPQSQRSGSFDEEGQEYRQAYRDNVTSRIRVPPPEVVVDDSDVYDNNETSPLLPKSRLPRTGSQQKGATIFAGDSYATSPTLGQRFSQTLSSGRQHTMDVFRSVSDPRNYTRKAVVGNLVGGLHTLSAVFLGLLLNVLDGLSYGMILFPLGSEIFKNTEADGISIFFVSCIVSQLCYSLGLSIFRGGVGSEMIEVVPFFHKMAYSIMLRMKDESPKAIMATTIVAYSMSSIVTGLIFLVLGIFKLGNLVSFFPRNILIGCIGGVGFFLVVTGVEVSARIGTNLNYDLATLKKLFQGDTFPLWITPLALAILVLVLRRRFKTPFVLPGFFIAVTAIFYIIVAAAANINLDNARNAGWIFPKPPSGVPFYHFYSYFDFHLVDWTALVGTIPAMFALSFFGIIHVPINVPALGVAVREDNVNVNRELIAHGISNTLSGCIGSIQNYLVYANSILFIDNGGDSRAAGITLAAATTAVWMAGPAMIGYIPVCIVGALIFMLGIELLEEAVWDTWGKLHRLEYLTIIAIVLIMGIYDFVVGIVVGIVLACLNYVVQSSRTPAIRASYSGEVAESTVRRPRTDRRYLNHVRRQIRVEKLSGMLFFGTIVAVEKHLRALIEDEAFKKRPVSFIVVDFSHVTGLDFSAAEGFQRINRILCRKHVKMVLSGVSFGSDVGKALDNVGLLIENGDPACPPPEVFEDLNMALEACENHLLGLFYKHRNKLGRKGTPPMSISADQPGRRAVPQHILNNTITQSFNSNNTSMDPSFHSPRREAQIQAADTTLREHGDSAINENDTLIPSKWKHFAQPIKIMLQTFEDVSDKNEDFWQRAAPFFQQRSYDAGSLLYSRGDEPDGFYVLEQGRLRAEYDLEQGNFYEVILPGTTCGELPFFSETDRTGTVAAENDSVAWLLTREKFRELEDREPAVASELLKVGLKLTKERMDAITSYVLVMAS